MAPLSRAAARAAAWCARRRALLVRGALAAAALAAASFALAPARAPEPLPALVRAPRGACACAAPAPPLPGDGPPSDFSAVIIETRALPALFFAVRHMACTLPADWPIVLVAAPDMRDFVASNFSDLLASGRLRAWELAPDAQALQAVCRDRAGGGWCVAAATAPARAVPRAPAFARWAASWEVCNQVPLSGALFAALPSRQYLVFQTDGLLCRSLTPAYTAALAAFDFVGAPWSVHPGAREDAHARGVGGNGGFSFRTAGVLAKTIEAEYASRWVDEPLTSFGAGAEDVFFSERLEAVGGRLPPRDFAREFAVETVPHAAPWGYHKPWWYLKEDDLRTLVENCPVIAESLAWTRPLDAPWDPASVAACRAAGAKSAPPRAP